MSSFWATMLGAGSIALGSLAQAATLNNDFGLANPDQTVDFESAPLSFNQSVTTQFSALGVTFTDAFANPDGSAYPNIVGNRIGNFQGGISFQPDFSIRFAQSQFAVAFAMVAADGGRATAVALLGGIAVETFIFDTSATSLLNYYGFRDIILDEVQIDVDSFDNALMIDNLQTHAVPEPTSWAMLLTGLLYVGARRRRTGHF